MLYPTAMLLRKMLGLKVSEEDETELNVLRSKVED